jgi:hypothetical protein
MVGNSGGPIVELEWQITGIFPLLILNGREQGRSSY